MNTIPWFERNLKFGYPIEMLPYFLERLDGTAIRIEGKVKGVSNEILSKQLNGKWSVKQNIGHLAEVDEINFRRIYEMIAGVVQLSPAVFEPKKDYNSQKVKDVIHYFYTTRLKNIRRYSELTESELTKSSLHPRLKVQMTPVDLAWFDAEHDDHHLVTINTILKSLTS
ncbi:MAG: DinB family protein [Bacteroidota bacterium]